MSAFSYFFIIVLFANAIVSFCIAFFWQAKVIFAIFGVSDLRKSFVPWKAVSIPNGPSNNFSRFLAGEIFPELRSKWIKAIVYVVISYVLLFSLGIIIAPTEIQS